MPTLRSFVLAAAVAATASLASAPAGAATLTIAEECRFLPGAYDCGSWHVVRYIGGAERNGVVVSGGRLLPSVTQDSLVRAAPGLTQFAVAVYDPGVPIAAGPFETPELDDPPTPTNEIDLLPVTRTWSCLAPTGESVGVCWATPGRECPPYLDCFVNVGFLNLVEVQLGDGPDSVRLVRGSPPAEVATGAGDDKVNAHNAVDDRIECGEGFDRVKAEVRDQVATTCEVVRRW
jgi:hypothetical protein